MGSDQACEKYAESFDVPTAAACPNPLCAILPVSTSLSLRSSMDISSRLVSPLPLPVEKQKKKRKIHHKKPLFKDFTKFKSCPRYSKVFHQI